MKLKIRHSQFFDRQAVIDRLPPAKLKYLRKSGGYVRRIARSSIKRTGWSRKPPRKYGKTGKVTKAWLKWWQEVLDRPAAPPGSPIRTHTGLAREAVLFGLDRTAESTVVGFSADKFDEIGALHEYGGIRFGARYPARPTIRPAMEKAQPKLAAFFRDSIR